MSDRLTESAMAMFTEARREYMGALRVYTGAAEDVREGKSLLAEIRARMKEAENIGMASKFVLEGATADAPKNADARKARLAELLDRDPSYGKDCNEEIATDGDVAVAEIEMDLAHRRMKIELVTAEFAKIIPQPVVTIESPI